MKQNSTPMYLTPPRSESQIYEDISAFLQAFKKMIALCELMYMNGSRGADNTNVITIFCDLFDQIKTLAQNYTKQVEVIFQGTTFSRFIYRLLEIIKSWKLKHKSKNPESETPFQKFLKQVEAYVRECQKKKSFFSLVSCTQILFLKFANKIITAPSQQGDTFQTERISQMCKKLKEQLGRLKDIGKLAIQKQYQTQKQLQAEESEALLEKKEKLIFTNRIFRDIQQSFDKFRGMDVDFSYFRGSYFQVKDNYDGFFQNYLQRNNFISTSIDYFSCSFNEYKKKREVINRKKSVKSQRLNQTNFQKMIPRYTEGDQSDSISYGLKQILAIPFHMTSDRLSGKLKSIYVNLGKGNKIKQQNEVSLTIHAKSNQARGKLNETCQPNFNNSLLLDQNMNRPKECFKTLPTKRQKQMNTDHNQVTNKMSKNCKITKYAISPKIQIKAKCFQIGKFFITTTKQLKNKVFPMNKFSIRQPVVNWVIQK